MFPIPLSDSNSRFRNFAILRVFREFVIWRFRNFAIPPFRDFANPQFRDSRISPFRDFTIPRLRDFAVLLIPLVRDYGFSQFCDSAIPRFRDFAISPSIQTDLRAGAALCPSPAGPLSWQSPPALGLRLFRGSHFIRTSELLINVSS